MKRGLLRRRWVHIHRNGFKCVLYCNYYSHHVTRYIYNDNTASKSTTESNMACKTMQELKYTVKRRHVLKSNRTIVLQRNHTSTKRKKSYPKSFLHIIFRQSKNFIVYFHKIAKIKTFGPCYCDHLSMYVFYFERQMIVHNIFSRFVAYLTEHNVAMSLSICPHLSTV